MYAHLSNSRKLCRQTCCTPQKHTDWKLKKALLSCKNRSAEIVSPHWIRLLFCLFYKLSRTKMLLIPEHILVQDLKCVKAEDEALKCGWDCVKSNIISWTQFDRNREQRLLTRWSSSPSSLRRVERGSAPWGSLTSWLSYVCECRPAEETGHVIQCQSQPYDVKCLVSSVGTFPLVARLQGGGGDACFALCWWLERNFSCSKKTAVVCFLSLHHRISNI